MSDAQPTGAESAEAATARPAGSGFDPTPISAATPTPAGAATATATPAVVPPRKGPLSFLSGSLTSFLFAWGCLLLSERVVGYYSVHPPHYSARVAQSIATAVKTLVVGMTFLATFTFAFVGLGLFLVFVRALFSPSPREST